MIDEIIGIKTKVIVVSLRDAFVKFLPVNKSTGEFLLARNDTNGNLYIFSGNDIQINSKMISEWRSMMDNLREAYYLVRLIVTQILMFLEGFIFHEFTWFAPTEEDLDANSKIRDIAPQRITADLFVLFIVCGLLFALMLLSANSPKDETTGYETADIETIPVSFEERSSSFWFPGSTSLQSIRCFHHTCGDCGINLCHVNRNIHTISQADKRKMLPQSRSLTYSARASNSQHFQKTEKDRSVYQTIPKDWLVRRTRSGHVYGKYPI